jgi:hypothetical protein
MSSEGNVGGSTPLAGGYSLPKNSSRSQELKPTPIKNPVNWNNPGIEIRFQMRIKADRTVMVSCIPP